ncbi:MAG: response regulator [Bacteroidia bacterium]
MPKILLVDDREDNLLSIESILEPGGYRFIKANSGRQALKALLNDHDFALILMDVKMPNLNGFETAELIYEREKLRHIPIIFVTAHGDDENIFKGYRSGAVDYIYKPINPLLLRTKVSVFAELYRKTNQLIAQEQKLTAINKNLENEINERKNSELNVKALNIQLLKNIDKLESANKDLDRFAFMASHDLQEPLRKIRTFSQLLYSQFQDQMNDESRMYINRIQTATMRLQDLIRDIMTFSRISVEKNAFIKTDLNLLVADVLSEMDSTIDELNAKITIEELPDLFVNPVLIRPLFQNLINNALKYSKKHVTPVIHIYADFPKDNEENLPENKYCRIFVEDNGIGFEQKYAEQIFKMFQRLHHKNEYEGTGIGLALCKKIVEEHNGYIYAKGEPGKGSTFIVTLPLANKSVAVTDNMDQAELMNK